MCVFCFDSINLVVIIFNGIKWQYCLKHLPLYGSELMKTKIIYVSPSFAITTLTCLDTVLASTINENTVDNAGNLPKGSWGDYL